MNAVEYRVFYNYPNPLSLGVTPVPSHRSVPSIPGLTHLDIRVHSKVGRVLLLRPTSFPGLGYLRASSISTAVAFLGNANRQLAITAYHLHHP